MAAIRTQEIILQNQQKRAFATTLRYRTDGRPKPMLLFVHGFKGFKDWGHFPLVAQYLAEQGFFILSMNLSMNGTTLEQPTDFADLEAFGRQTYAQDLADISSLLDYLHNASEWATEVNRQQIYLLGHSRGGAVALLAAAKDTRIKKVITWASVAESDFVWTASRVAELLAEGKSNVPNARTGQLMPLYEEGYREAQGGQYLLEKAVKSLQIPILLLHGTADSSVLPEKAALLKQWANRAKLHYIEGANHTFGGAHPYLQEHLPAHTAEALALCLDFLREG